MKATSLYKFSLKPEFFELKKKESEITNKMEIEDYVKEGPKIVFQRYYEDTSADKMYFKGSLNGDSDNLTFIFSTEAVDNLISKNLLIPIFEDDK